MMVVLISNDSLLKRKYEQFFRDDSLTLMSFSIKDLPELSTENFFPSVILLDAVLSLVYTLNLIQKLKSTFPGSKIIVLSNILDSAAALTALKHGANGFILKSESLHFIKETLLALQEGGIFISPLVLKKMFLKNAINPKNDFLILTKRERELVQILQSGVSNKVAAGILNVSFFTVNQHLKSIYKKLHINSKSELLSIAIRAASISSD